MIRDRIALGLCQLLVEGGQLDANLTRAEAMVRQAAARGCDVVVLPECLDLGWTDESARELAQPIPGPASDRLCNVAREARVFLVAGLTERAEDRIYNSAILVSLEGRILLKHRKINILTIAQDLYSVGESLSVAHTSLGTIGVDICSDNFPDSLVFGHSLARMGAQMILSPCAWAVDADYDNVQAPYGALWRESYTKLARLYDVAVVGVSNTGWIRSGPWKGRKCIGCSLAVGPGGTILAQAPYGEAAECLTPVTINVVERTVKGTAIAEALREKGYNMG